MSAPGPGPGSPSEPFETRLRRALYPLGTHISELPIEGYSPESVDKPRAAAVLVGVMPEEPGVVLTLRSERLARHAGQVAFPGGAREPGDESVVDTALREAHEEASIPPAGVRPLGFLARYDTITGYRMTAVVGLLDSRVRPRPDESEVERVFTVPLARVADADAYRVDRFRYAGRRFEVLTLEHAEYRIWGATAALLFDFGRRLRQSAGYGDSV